LVFSILTFNIQWLYCIFFTFLTDLVCIICHVVFILLLDFNFFLSNSCGDTHTLTARLPKKPFMVHFKAQLNTQVHSRTFSGPDAAIPTKHRSVYSDQSEDSLFGSIIDDRPTLGPNKKRSRGTDFFRRVQRVTQLRFGRRNPDPAKDRPPT